MKKYSLLLTFLLLLSFTSFSQRFEGGIVAGLSGSQIDGDEQAGYKKLGAWGGLYIKTMLSEKIAFQTGLSYIGKGARLPADPNQANFEFKTHLNYIEIPVVLEYSFIENFSVQAGLAPAYLVSGKREENGVELPSEFNSMDIAAIAGVNYVLTERLTAKIRMAYSILFVADNPRQFNNCMSLGLFYRLGKGEEQ